MDKMSLYSLLLAADMLVKVAVGGQMKKKCGQDELVFTFVDSRYARRGCVWCSEKEEVWSR